jgi:PAS domain S-box-containing protein
MASIQRAVTAGALHDVEYRIVSSNGVVRWVEGKGRLERGPDGHLRMTGVCVNITRRKQDELARIEALNDSHRASQRLAAIVESSDDAIVSKDLRGVITSWNRGAQRMFGYTAEEAIGQSIMMIVPEDRRAEELRVLERLRANLPVELETVRQRKDGTTVEISLMVSPLLDADGHNVGASKIARDISARKRDEAERAELDRRLRLLVTASASLLDSPETESVRSATVSLAQQLLDADGYALWTLDPDAEAWRVVRSDGISASFAGQVVPATSSASTRDQLSSEPMAVPDVTTDPRLATRLDAYTAEGIHALLACPMRLGSGNVGTLAFYFRRPQMFRDVEIHTGQALANLAAAALTTASLSDEQRTQRDLAESERRHASFLADATAILSRSSDDEEALAALARLAVPDFADWCAIDIVDDTGCLERRAEASAGVAPEDDSGVFKDLQPDGGDAAGGPQEVFRTGRTAMMALAAANAPTEFEPGTGSRQDLTSYICAPLVSTRGTLGTLTFAFAGSGRHYVDRDVAFVEDVATRAALAIENAFAYRRAHEANRLKDEFLATLSHELRTPLNAILGYAQLLSLGALDVDRQSKALAVVMRNAESLRQIIEEVLDVARITFGKVRVNMAPVRMDEVLKHAVTTVRRSADAKGISLQLTLDEHDDAVFADPERLQQIVWNLLSNAVKFTPRGGHVQLRLEHLPAAVRVVISDDGEGIDP